jgi:hypothetical protein
MGHPEHTETYIWGDKTIEHIRCKHCGCVTHWLPLDPTDRHMAVNIRNFDPQVLDGLRIRRFDGAESWSYIDDGA